MYVLDEYSVNNLDEIINKKAVLDLEYWYKTSKKPLLIFGPTGIGKSTIVNLFAKKNNLTIYELTPSDNRDKETIESNINAVANSKSLFNNKNLLFFDDIDVFFSDDRGGFETILKATKTATNPVIFCATNIYADKKLSELREICELIEIKPLYSNVLLKYIEKILESKKIKYEINALTELIKLNSNDLRSLFLDIDFLKHMGIYKENLNLISGRERKNDVFKTVIGLFKSKTFEEAKKISDASEIDYDLLNEWIIENLPLFYEGENLKKAYYYLSLASLNKTRIYSRQNWIFFKYFLIFGIIAPTMPIYKDKFSYKISFPQSIKKRMKESSTFAKNKQLANIFSKVFKGSNLKIISELYLYEFFLKSDEFKDYLLSKLTEEEINVIENHFKTKIIFNNLEKLEPKKEIIKKEELKLPEKQRKLF